MFHTDNDASVFTGKAPTGPSKDTAAPSGATKSGGPMTETSIQEVISAKEII